jgi:hypothetical protein
MSDVNPIAPPKPEPFACPSCAARYKLVRVEAAADRTDPEITCRSCGGPLQAREGRYALKYFLVDRPRAQARKGRRDSL